ncbi:unnamed protein product [Aspergillus oryzae]|nr:unnamed protein product [Aspergillus oryzae]GMG08606.1 unnamed protein product [Aspergillus oryzae]GMG51509.1 unnamed protein product [Aspergillus oryzae var. brunneus]
MMYLDHQGVAVKQNNEDESSTSNCFPKDKLYVALLEKPGSVSIPRKNIVFEDMTRTLLYKIQVQLDFHYWIPDKANPRRDGLCCGIPSRYLDAIFYSRPNRTT